MRTALFRTSLVSMLIAGASVFSAEVDLYTAEMQSLKREYKQQAVDYAKLRMDALKNMLQDNLKQQRETLEEKQKSGNMTAMAIARTAIGIFENCSEELEKKKDFEFPAKVRRELVDTIDACRQKKKEIDDQQNTVSGPLRERSFMIFSQKALAQTGKAIADARLRELFGQLIESEDRVSTPAATPKTTPESRPGPATRPGGEPPETPAPRPRGETAKPPSVPVPEPLPPDVIDSSGSAKDWITLAHWSAEVSGVEMISIPVVNIGEEKKETGAGGESGMPYRTAYRPFQTLKTAAGAVFRLKSVPKQLGADVVEWPDAGNNWNLLVRLKPSAGVPSKHALEIQVGAGVPLQEVKIVEKPAEVKTAVVTGVTAGAEPPPPPKKATVSVKTEPAGAAVCMDGKICMSGKEPLRTPCSVDATEGRHDISVQLSGYVDGEFRAYAVKPDAAIDWKFVKEQGPSDSVLKVFSSEGWRESNVRVDKGDRLILSASGTWSCSPEEEKVGPEGFPRGGDYMKYYLGSTAVPRVDDRSNYGALVMKIGEKGGVRAVGRELKVIAETGGLLYFGINEANRGGALGDNKGSMTIHVQDLGRGK